ncbi:E3 ubiquitin-protein ligase rnf213-alpha-like [Hemiscyllium ocellatum]|uniref:E3 ubiquitin-protein ligase rnf213-alpha-like n=1 Tax=Hemiscyllium ocellatum TaxID=170820 RepID=UPI0029662851|nr:E3 ubiquitin-protein ligase rnf213-alpha-like [Hemiscyllium ocellatum]
MEEEMDTEQLKMKCHSCGHITKEKAPKFCSQCGTRLVESIVEAAMPLISGKTEAEATDASIPMDVDLELCSTSNTATESEMSSLEPEAPPCKLQCGQNSDLMAISEKESKTSECSRKGSSNKKKKRKKKPKKLNAAEMASSTPQLRHLSKSEQKDIETELHNKVAAADEHPPNSPGIEEVSASCDPVGNLVNLDIDTFQSDIVSGKNKNGAVHSITESDLLQPNKSDKSAYVINEGSLITEKLSSRKDGTQPGRGSTPDKAESTLTSAVSKQLHTADSDLSNSVEGNNNQYGMKKEKDILLTQKNKKRQSNNLSAAVQSKEIPSARQSENLYSDCSRW